LAILLIISGNFLIEKRRIDKLSGVENKIQHFEITPLVPVAEKKLRVKKQKVKESIEQELETFKEAAAQIVPIEPVPVEVSAPVEAMSMEIPVVEDHSLADQIIDFGPETAPNESNIGEPILESLSEADLDSLLKESIAENAPAILKISDTASAYSNTASHFDSVSDSATRKADVKFQFESGTDWKPSDELKQFRKL